MTTAESKELLAKAVDELPPEKVELLVEYAESLRRASRPRRRNFGFARGQVNVHPSFFDPLPDDILDAFEGKGE
ncbi:MAG: hypothetical protein ACE15C_17360 [Phycisphaerae bacterium]